MNSKNIAIISCVTIIMSICRFRTEVILAVAFLLLLVHISSQSKYVIEVQIVIISNTKTILMLFRCSREREN